MGRPRRAAGWGKIRFELRGDTWHADARYRDASGNDRRHRAHGPTPEVAELRLRALASHADADADLTATSTVRQLALFWLAERQIDVEARLADPQGRAGVAPQSLVKYRSDIESSILPRLGGHLLGELDAPRLEKALREVQRESDAKARRVRGLLRQMLDEAVRTGALPASPLAPARRVRTNPAAPVAYDAAQLHAIREAWQAWIRDYTKPGPKPSEDVLDALLISAATSMRIGEVLALRPLDVALDAEPPHLRVTGTLVQVESIPLHRQEHPKDARQARAIRLPMAAVTILRRRTSATKGPEHPLWPAVERRSKRSGHGHLGPRWRSPHNVRRTIRDFRVAREEDLRTAGVNPDTLRPKSMRSTAATAVAHALTPEHAAALAGHRSVAVTHQHYIGRLEMIDGGQADVLDALLGD
ncbi:hypothetical protein AA0Z99_00105 [Agrococcus sp. 1P02AA]|uniref:phage integrase central domain-containing protein n=1 Tax=Agrococcus sp. 1P02AA TaxID=3132259 RepID=UPI0039A4C65E